ncbi:MAG: SIS domain-containing protein [Acidimicrobiales bacterium]
MAAEMAEQPDVLARLIERRSAVAGVLGGCIPDPLHGIVLVARGSSDHAAVYGRYVLETATGKPVGLAAPSLHTLYRVPADYRRILVVGISQSGRTPEIVTVLERLKAAGAATLAVTNDVSSPLAQVGDAVVDLGAGSEEAVPATKTFTATVAVLAFLAEALGRVPWSGDQWKRVPEAVSEALADDAPPRHAAGVIGDAGGLVVVARGFLFGVALEAALKLKEAAAVLAQGYSAADLLHGPIAVVEEDFPVVLLHVPGPTAADVAELVATLRHRGAEVLRVAPDPHAELPVPGDLPEALAAFPVAVRAQQLAHALALHRGLDPDRPPGLTKVTPTT